MIARSKAALIAAHKPRERLPVSAWNEKHVDFAKVPAYDTPYKGKYSLDLFPFWREPADSLSDLDVKEIWVRKCARAGASECVLLAGLRHTVACDPQPCLYISADQRQAERFMRQRLLPSLKASSATADKLDQATRIDTEVSLADMTLVVGWASNPTIYRGDGYGLILGDEVSLWPEFSADLLRKRTATYPFAHLVFVSSPDPTRKGGPENDPIFREFADTDCREWQMQCPTCQSRFTFRFGGIESRDGVKWDDSARMPSDDGDTWDLQQVYDSAHYVAPCGHRIEESKRLDVVATGHWMPTNPNAHPGKRGYAVNSLMMPWRESSFGGVAQAFLKAVANGDDAVGRYFAEWWGTEHHPKHEAANESVIFDRIGSHGKGQRFSQLEPVKSTLGDKSPIVLLTVDVQQGNLFWLAREWLPTGDSGLVDWGMCVEWSEVEAAANKYQVHRVYVDSAYVNRRAEVLDYCTRCHAIPIYGNSKLQSPIRSELIDPYEGLANQGRLKIKRLVFEPDIFRQSFFEMMTGQRKHVWSVYRGIEHEYIRQVTAEHRINGEWKRLRRDNHMFDLETYQVLAAYSSGLLPLAL